MANKRRLASERFLYASKKPLERPIELHDSLSRWQQICSAEEISPESVENHVIARVKYIRELVQGALAWFENILLLLPTCF